MKLEDIKFIKDLYERSDFMITQDSIFQVTYFPEAKKYGNKEYEVQMTYFSDIDTDSIKLMSKIDKEHPVSKQEEAIKKYVDDNVGKISVKDLIFSGVISSIFLRSVAINKGTLYKYNKKELIEFLKPLELIV